MTVKSLISRLVLYFTAIIVTFGICASAYSEGSSVLEVVPQDALVCLKLTNLRDLDGKLSYFMKSLGIPATSGLNIAQFIGKMTGTEASNLLEMEDAGFDMRGDACIFWTTLSPEKFSVAIRVTSRVQAELSVRTWIGGASKKYQDITYGISDGKFAWVFLDDVFVYSKDKSDIVKVIDAHLKDKPSILQDEKYLAGTKSIRAAHLMGYVDLDSIISTFQPLLQSHADKMKRDVSHQMAQQMTLRKKANLPVMDFDVAKIFGAEMDMGLWLLKQMKSYAVSIDVGRSGIWVNDSLRFRQDSPICRFLKTRPRNLELIDYLPDDVCFAGSATLDAVTIKKFNDIMFDMMMSVVKEKIDPEKASELRGKYEAAVHDILSCLGDEIAFAIPTKSDRMMQRVIYILEITDEDKARSTIGNLDYVTSISKPFTKIFGMNFQMTKGPTQTYNGVRIESFQMDLSQMASFVPNGASMYPATEFLWYAFVDDKMIYAMSQSSGTIKRTIDAVEGRTPGVKDAPGFEDIDIRLPERSNMAVYISPAGYLKFIMGMMMPMGKGIPSIAVADVEKPSIGFAVTTKLDGSGVRNFTYFRTEEIQELMGTGMSLAQRMQPRARIQTRVPVSTKE